jgi:hypothetical protein
MIHCILHARFMHATVRLTVSAAAPQAAVLKAPQQHSCRCKHPCFAHPTSMAPGSACVSHRPHNIILHCWNPKCRCSTHAAPQAACARAWGMCNTTMPKPPAQNPSISGTGCCHADDQRSFMLTSGDPSAADKQQHWRVSLDGMQTCYQNQTSSFRGIHPITKS